MTKKFFVGVNQKGKLEIFVVKKLPEGKKLNPHRIK